ncbi:MAG: glucose-6-phosphate dehydrogenase, partial [Patescibacteria group bacterium]
MKSKEAMYQRLTTPTVFVIFGMTGDLSENKLLPALFDVFAKRLLPEKFRVVGFSRRELSEKDMAALLQSAVQKKFHRHTKRDVARFAERLSYIQGDFGDNNSYRALVDHLKSIDDGFAQCSNKLFYLAVSPVHYATIFRQLAASGLTKPCGGEFGWTRVLVEKPFGRDTKTAKQLDTLLSRLFKEEQIFRIDHYLEKEMIQNIVTFRFANAMFEPVWNREYIDRVEIRLLEKEGIAGRGEFYDALGALRDVGENHLLQMLALITMETPDAFDSAHIRSGRAKALQSLRIVTSDMMKKHAVRAQYAGYQQEPGVKKNSQTETYFRLIAHLSSPRWRGVPFLLESGKCLNERRAEISVVFKGAPLCTGLSQSPCQYTNILRFHIQPNEGISVCFWTKSPGFKNGVEERELSFEYQPMDDPHAKADPYQKLLFDAMHGDQTSFASSEEVAAAWKFITPIIEGWGSLPLQ